MFWTEAEDTIPLLSSGNFAGVMPQSIYTAYGIGGTSNVAAWDIYVTAISGTSTILIALPLIIAFIFLQNKIVQGIERSGIVG